MNALDLVLIACAVVYAVTGFQQGFLVGSCATVGLFAGGALAIKLVPALLDRFTPGFAVSVAALLIVLFLAFLGQAAGSVAGQRLRHRVTWRPARVIDALSGAALSVAAMLVMAWALGVAATGAQLDEINQEVRSSAVLGAVDDVMPGGSERLMSAFDAVVSSTEFPRYLEPFAPERIVSVRPPTVRIVRDRDVTAAARSVVKIVGEAPACSETLEGTGFVFAPHRVMTNAHVVGGVRQPIVRLGGIDHQARVVYYDPDVDVAVLAVPTLDAPSLRFGRSASSGRAAVVLGYPQDGPYDAEPARVRSREQLRSPDIYGNGAVSRDTYSLYARVRPGNSGGPLLSAQGRVLGVVFAASLVDDSTGYALTVGQVVAAARRGTALTRPVSTGGCAL